MTADQNRMQGNPWQRDIFRCGIPAKRLGKPDDIRDSLALLVSDAADRITGKSPRETVS